MYIDQFGFHVWSTPTPCQEGWGRQSVDTGLANIWTDVVCEAIRIRTVCCILANLVSTFCLPQPHPEEGWGRQTVDTVLVNMWTGAVREAISIRTL